MYVDNYVGNGNVMVANDATLANSANLLDAKWQTPGHFIVYLIALTRVIHKYLLTNIGCRDVTIEIKKQSKAEQNISTV